MKVTLLGLEFASVNLGCEALAYSFASELERVSMELAIDCEYTAVLFDLKDNITLPGSGKKIECLKIRYKSMEFWTTLVRVFKESDLIFDFTGGDSFSDIYGKKRFYMATIIKVLAIRSKTPFILGPQTYGPYQRKLVKAFAKKVIADSEIVFARDKVSQDFAATLAKREVKLAPDVAFALPYDKPKRSERGGVRVGINPSGLLWNGGYSHAKIPLTVDYQQYCNLLLENLTKTEQYEVHLISHVGGKGVGEVESDYFVCKLLHERFPKTILVDVFETPMDAKTYIAGMDVLVAARMHASIAAFSTEVATIPFSYSRKFEGLYNSVGYEYVVHACVQESAEAVEMTMKYIKDYRELIAKAEASMEEVRELQNSFANELKGIVERIKK